MGEEGELGGGDNHLPVVTSDTSSGSVPGCHNGLKYE